MTNTAKRGFASMSREERSRIAAMGGRASGGNFKHNPTRAKIEGSKGGKMSPSKFAVDDEQARPAACGRKGGRNRTRAP